jgi:hypothetical protein
VDDVIGLVSHQQHLLAAQREAHSDGWNEVREEV